MAERVWSMCSRSSRIQAGFTLIEIVTTIIVVAVAAAALLGVFGGLIQSSADPAIQQQAVTIAESYMEEIRSKAFDDPDGAENGLGSAEEGTGNRAIFDDVQDYNDLGTTEVRSQTNTPITELAAYSVTVVVDDPGLNGIPAADALRIRVTVDHPAIDALSLVGYRTDY